MSTHAFVSTDSVIASDLSGLIETGTPSLIFDPEESFFSTTSLFSLVQSFSPEGSQLISDWVESVDQISGTVTFDGGIVSVDLTAPQGSIQTSFDGVGMLNDFAQLATETNGTLNLSQGVFTADLTSGDDTFVDVFNLADLASNWVESVLFDLETATTFENGLIALDLPTPLGNIAGNLGFAGGQLSLDLSTPLGDLTSAIDFGEEAQISLDQNDAVVLDFNRGDLLLDIFPIGPEIAIPLENLSGTLAIDDGVATVGVSTFLGNFEDSLELGPIASELAADFLSDLSAEAVVEAGVLSGSLMTPYGALEGSIDFPQLANQGADFLSQVGGTVTISEGLAISNLETPFGPVADIFDLEQFVTFLNLPVAELV